MDDGKVDIARGAFAERLRAAAAKKSWKQAELARRSDISPALIGAYWHGKKRATGDKLFALASVLGVDPRWLAGGVNGTASHLLDEIDSLIEAGEDQAVEARAAELDGITNDPDLAPNLRNRALYILAAMGDEDARRRHRHATKEVVQTYDSNRSIMESALSRAQEAQHIDIGEDLRQAIKNFGGYLLVARPENVAPDVLHWLIHSLVEAINDRISISHR